MLKLYFPFPFLTILTKYSLNIFAILISLSIISSLSINMIVGLALTLFEKRGLTFCQNFLLSKTEFRSRFAKWYFFYFFQEVFVYLFFSGTILSRKKLYQSLERLIITLCKYFVMNVPWFALYFIFIGACLFKMSIKMLKECSDETLNIFEKNAYMKS